MGVTRLRLHDPASGQLWPAEEEVHLGEGGVMGATVPLASAGPEGLEGGAHQGGVCQMI